MDSKYPLVYIASRMDPNIMGLFYDMGFRGTNDLMIADLCVFTGGEDVNPQRYNEVAISECGRPNEKRDAHEATTYRNCVEFKVPMVGICRGAQFLNVMNGGRLWQHVDNHGSSHHVKCLLTDEVFTATSTHHQMMRPASNGEIIGIAHKVTPDVTFKTPSLTTTRMAAGITQIPSVEDVDPEIVWYEETRSMCVQFHPEYHKGTEQCRPFFIRLVESFYPELFKKEAA